MVRSVMNQGAGVAARLAWMLSHVATVRGASDSSDESRAQ